MIIGIHLIEVSSLNDIHQEAIDFDKTRWLNIVQ